MSILDSTYFKDELKIPIDNIDYQSYIDKHEPIILRKILGYALYKAFIAGLAESTVLQKWTDLQGGVEYTDGSDVLQRYDGIYEIIANYVFVQIVSDKQSYMTDMGIKWGASDNAEPFNPRYKQVYAQNDMYDRAIVLDEFINVTNNASADTYADYLPETQTKGNVFNI